jgi:hypothetical protein
MKIKGTMLQGKMVYMLVRSSIENNAAWSYASTTPRKNLKMTRLRNPWAKAVAPERNPQATIHPG